MVGDTPCYLQRIRVLSNVSGLNIWKIVNVDHVMILVKKDVYVSIIVDSVSTQNALSAQKRMINVSNASPERL